MITSKANDTISPEAITSGLKHIERVKGFNPLPSTLPRAA